MDCLKKVHTKRLILLFNLLLWDVTNSICLEDTLNLWFFCFFKSYNFQSIGPQGWCFHRVAMSVCLGGGGIFYIFIIIIIFFFFGVKAPWRRRCPRGGMKKKRMLKSFLAVVLLSASVERCFVSRIRDLLGTFLTVLGIFTYFNIAKKPYLKNLSHIQNINVFGKRNIWFIKTRAWRFEVWFWPLKASWHLQ